MFLLRLYQIIGEGLMGVREWFWDYPDKIFFGRNSFSKNLKYFYLRSRPFSHAFVTLLIFLVVGLVSIQDISAVLRIHDDALIEGVIVGQDEDGELLRVASMNPLIVTNIQLKRDISELVYEPLLKVNQQNDKTLVLAESYADTGDGKVYRFKLKENVKWHDGEDFNADDVVATFELLKTLEYASQTSSVYSKAATKINVTKIDDYRVEFSLIDKDAVIPNFFEVMSFKVLPEHLMGDLNSSNIVYPTPNINRNPIGTGPFMVGPLNRGQVELTRFESYHDENAKLKKIIFKLFKEQEQAITELKTGQIHSLIGINSDSVQELSTVPNMKINKSNVIYNQYWGLYFNLSDQTKPVLKDKGVRQAIDRAINKKLIAEALVGSAVVADGPIPQTSFAYADSVKRPLFSYEEAESLLDKAGWKENTQGIRTKDGEILSLDLVYVKNTDRDKVVDLIEEDLLNVGIEVNPIAKTINEVNNDHLLPSQFDILLYGVSTFLDPDRYELFHSSQIGYPNLNIASYKSEEETTIIESGEKKRIPKVDQVLEKGRSIIDEKARAEEYEIFQRIVLDEMPVSYLYHPVYTYITNKRVENVVLTDMTALEDRFNTVTQWEIGI